MNKRQIKQLLGIFLAILMAGFVACEGPEAPTGTQGVKSARGVTADMQISAVLKNRGKIAFTGVRDGTWDIYMMNADGTDQANLTNHPSTDFEPAWSPNGKYILFRSDRDGNGEIYRMNADGTAQTNLTDHPGADRDPAWRKQPGNKK